MSECVRPAREDAPDPLEATPYDSRYTFDDSTEADAGAVLAVIDECVDRVERIARRLSELEVR